MKPINDMINYQQYQSEYEGLSNWRMVGDFNRLYVKLDSKNDWPIVIEVYDNDKKVCAGCSIKKGGISLRNQQGVIMGYTEWDGERIEGQIIIDRMLEI